MATIRNGRLVAVEEVASLKARALHSIEVTFAADVDPAYLRSVPGVSVHGPAVALTVAGALDPLVKALARHEVISITTHEPDLEELVLAYYDDDPGDA